MNNARADNLRLPDLIELVLDWQVERNLIDGASNKAQYLKLIEECGELAGSLCRGREIADDIGDILVVMIGMCERAGLSLTDCLAVAYDDIKDRKGMMIDGVYIKEADYQSA